MSLDVLIVDDHEPMRAMLRAVLERSGAAARVREASCGAQALALMAERSAQLVLCDQSMPGMSGVELLLRLRATPAHAGVRVLLLSGHTDAEFTKAAEAAGADAVLVKPIKPSALLRAIAVLAPAAAPAAIRA